MQTPKLEGAARAALEVLAAFAAVLLLFLLVVGCASSDGSETPAAPLTEKDVFARVLPALCDRFAACAPDAFKARFGSQIACVDAMKPPHPETPAACTSAELDTCVSDVTRQSCTAISSTSPLPDSCKRCDP